MVNRRFRGGAASACGGPDGRGLGVAELEAVLIEDVGVLLRRWRRECADRPGAERSRLLLLALEREQIVAVAYREEAVAGRVAELDVGDQARALIRQTLVWIWKDEQLHAEFTRGLLLEAGGLASSLVVYGRQVQGALSGWTSSTATNRMARSAPLRTGAAGVLVAAAKAARRMPAALARELRYQTFHKYCALNVALESSAEFAYRRLVEVARSEEERVAFDRIRADEARHAEAFRLLTEVITEDDRLADGVSAEDLAARLARISPWFIPAAQRPRTGADEGQRSFGSGAQVVVRGGRTDADKPAVLSECLDRAGLDRLAGRARSAAIRVSFMLGYDCADRSNVSDPELVDLLARYLRQHGVADVAVLEAPTVYGNLFSGRSVASVARYFGFASPAYRIVDIGADMRPWVFDRGFVQKTISGTWLDADLRIVMPKLRTDPTEFAHLSLSTLEGSTGAIDESVLRRAQRGLPVRHHDAAGRGAAALRGRGRLGAGGRRPVRGDGMPSPGPGPLPLRRGRRAGRGRGCPGRPRYRRPPAGADRRPGLPLVRPGARVGGRRRASAPLRQQLRGAHSSSLLRAPRPPSPTRSTCT